MTNEQTELFRRMDDLAERCAKKGCVTNGSFLTPAEQLWLRSFRLSDEVRLVLAGGGTENERRCPFFLPWYAEDESEAVNEVIRAVHIKSYFGTAGHRDYLGAILALGIRREWLGDIRIEGDTAWVFCLASVEKTLLELRRVGRCSVRAEACAPAEVPVPEKKVKNVSFTVKSLRLDAVTGEMFSLSRTSAAEQIRLGLVSLNYAPCEQVDAGVKVGDVISLRGKGKGSLTELGGLSKKERIFVSAELWL